MEGDAVDEVTDGAATEEALDVFNVGEDCRDRFLPVWGFLVLRDDMALEMLLLADKTPEAASDWVAQCRILISPNSFS